MTPANQIIKYQTKQKLVVANKHKIGLEVENKFDSRADHIW